MLTSYHTSNFDSKTNNHLVTQYAPALFGYLFNCFEALLTPIKYSRQSVKWITFPMEVIENVLTIYNAARRTSFEVSRAL